MCGYCLTVSKVFWQVLNFPNGYSLSKLLRGEMKAVSFKRRSGSIFLHMFCINLPPETYQSMKNGLTMIWTVTAMYFGHFTKHHYLTLFHQLSRQLQRKGEIEMHRAFQCLYAITSVNSLAEWTRRAICAVHD